MSEVIESRQPAIWTEAELPGEPQPLPSEPEPQRPARLQPVNRNQLLWRTVDVEKLVGPDHLVRAIWELVGQLDRRATALRWGRWRGWRGVRPMTRAC